MYTYISKIVIILTLAPFSGFAQSQEFWSLGLGSPYPVSSIHGTGIGNLLGTYILHEYILYMYIYTIVYECI